ncbi:MAG: hypothetical protein LBD22_03615 [Spirochaetaceae bacterium]|nr:hypothetical protein [Spirochaetaceae bacterium]
MKYIKQYCVFGMMAACIPLVLSSFACKASGFSTQGDNDANAQTNAQDLYLETLELSYKSDISQNLIAQFAKEVNGYSVALTGHENDKLVVNATTEDKDITIAVMAKGTTTTEMAVPKAGENGFDIEILLSKSSGETGKYTITITPAQLSNDDNNDLQNLVIAYAAGDVNLVQNFSSINTTYSIHAVKDKTSAEVTATAASKTSTVELIYASNSKGSATGGKSATIGLPAWNSPAQTLVARVTSAKGQARDWIVAVNAYRTKTVTWQGIVQYQDADKVITNVTARDAAMTTQTAKLSTLNARTANWVLDISETWMPESFLVTLKDSNNIAYESTALFPQITSPATAIMLTVNARDTGTRIANANELVSKLGNDPTGNYSLANNIDLSEYVDSQGKSAVWNGPSGYKGTFYGNGYTIKNLILKKNAVQVGLFSTVEDGAVMQDFTLEVSNESPNDTISNVHFGGIVGKAHGTMTVRNVMSRGTLSFSDIVADGFILIGGIIGETELSPGKLITLERCASILDITIMNGNRSDTNTLGFGGLIGKVAKGAHVIKNSYAAGNIHVTNTGNKRLAAGGLIGDVWGTTLTISSSYAAGEVIAVNKNTSWADDRRLYAGGLIGESKQNSIITIENSAALNPKVLAVASYTAGAHFGRLIGGVYGQHTAVYNNNVVWSGMHTGTTTAGTADTAIEALDSPKGFGVEDTVQGLRNASLVWTGMTSYLNLDPAIWDVSGVSQGVWPKLRP